MKGFIKDQENLFINKINKRILFLLIHLQFIGKFFIEKLKKFFTIRLILAAVLITHKYYTDPFYLNRDISGIGGVHLLDLNSLEEEFLDIIDFNLTV